MNSKRNDSSGDRWEQECSYLEGGEEKCVPSVPECALVSGMHFCFRDVHSFPVCFSIT